MQTTRLLFVFLVFSCVFSSIEADPQDAFIRYGYPKGSTQLKSRKGLKQSHIANRFLLNKAESLNIQQASSVYGNIQLHPYLWMNERTLCQIHKSMFGNVWIWAGRYHKGPKRNLGVSNEDTPLEMSNLCANIPDWFASSSDKTFIELSAQLLHSLTKIHPYTNGNGRYARFVAGLFLNNLHGFAPLWPEHALLDEGNERSLLINALKTADDGNQHELVALMLAYGARNPSMMDLVENHFFRKYFSISQRKRMLMNIYFFDIDVRDQRLAFEPSPKKMWFDVARALISNDIHSLESNAFPPFVPSFMLFKN